MRNKWIYVAMLVLSFSLATACSTPSGGGNNAGAGDKYEDYNPDKQPGGDQFGNDGNYVAPELTIDGKGDDEQWKAISKPLATFGNGNAATVKAYRGDNALFFLFEVQDKILLTEGETNDDAVTRSDSIEFYLDTLANGGLKPQSDDYQINLGIHGKTRIMQGSGSGWGNWNGLIDYEVSLNGTLNDSVDANDTGYSVEVMIPYTQINIEKNDTIAVSFGQVDKVALGNAATTDWDWYPWIYNGVVTEPQTPNNYVLLDKNNGLMARDEEEKPNAEMAGYVLDSLTDVPVANVTVSVEIGGAVKTATTDESGFFAFDNVDPEGTYTVTVSKDGYISNSAVYTRAELREANGGRVLKNITIINEETVDRTALKGVVKNLIDGAIGGATIRIEGTTFETTSSADGAFTITGVPVEENKDVTLVVSKAGYGESKTVVKNASLQVNASTELGDVNLNRPYAETGGFGNKSDKFADSTMKLSRTLTGVEFNLTGTRQLTGHIEVYVDTKECAAHRDSDKNFWCFNLNDTGFVTGNHYAGGGFSAEGLEYTLYYNNATGYAARFFVPYDYLGITPLEVFGISLGQWSTSATDWDGWGFAGQFVAPETPETLIRLSATNELYRSASNASMVNLSGNVGMQGVRVTIGDYATTSGANGSWNMKVPATSSAMKIVYTCQGYEPYESEIRAGYFDTNYSYNETVSMQTQKVSISGVVTDKDSGKAIANVTVSIAGLDVTATTDANGAYTLTGVPTANDIIIKFTATDYTNAEVTLTAQTLASLSTHTVDTSLISENRVQYLTVVGKVENVNGAIENATVSVEGNSELTATTDAQGRFEIKNFVGADCKLVIAKSGYISKEISFSASTLTGTETEYDFGTVDVMMEYGVMQGVIADKSSGFAAFKGYVTRSATGFEFKFVGARAFAGRIELFVDTKSSAADNARDTSDYLFNLNADGTIQIVNWGVGEKNETVPGNMVLTVKNANSTPEVYFTLPYSFLGVSKTEVIGISVGQWSTSVNDWDGWDNFNLIGISNTEFVKPEYPQDYVRISATNTLYAKADNETVDFSSYQIHFGTGMMTTQTGSTEAGALGNAGLNADDMYAKVLSRDASGVTFEIITTGNFGTNSATNEKEMVLIYFDTGSESLDGWRPDYLIKIFSDGTVYGRASNAWWSASDADKLGSTATITKENGVTKIVYKVTYDTIGVGATDVFGIAMREASHNGGDHMLYDPWHDCYFEKETVGIDAAACTQFIRVSADGKLYRDNDNTI